MSIDAMKQALEALEECTAYTSSESWSPSMTRECETAITALRAAIEQAQPELVCVCGAIWEGQELVSSPPPRQWKGLTDDDVKAPIQRAMQYFGYDSTQYSLGGMATIGFLGLVKEIEWKLKEKNA